MEDQAKRLVKFGEKEADSIQVSISTIDEMGIDLRAGQVYALDASLSNTVMVRAIIDGKEGFSFSNKATEEVVSKAIKMARCAPKSEYFYGLPEPSKFPEPKIFDKEVAAMDVDDLLEEAKVMSSIAKEGGVILSQGGFSRTVARIVMANSNGIEGSDKETHTQASISMVSKKAETSSCWDYLSSNHRVSTGDVTKNVLDHTLLFGNRSHIKDIPKTVIFSPRAMAELLTYGFLDNLNGKLVEKRKSLFQSVGEKAASEDISIVDDGKMDWGIRSSRFDYEGCPKQRTPLIEDGEVTHFIYDFNTAKHEGKESTGNADHDGIDFNNIILKGPYSEINRALVVDSVIGAHTANSTTTSFSVKSENAYIIDGDTRTAIEECMVYGKISEILKDIISISRQVEQRMGICLGAVATGSVKITPSSRKPF